MDTLPIAVVAYAVSLSMGKIFAQKHRYIVDSNQELLAQGLANVGGSFFSALPISASLSRSLIQESVGGKTQIASIVSCFLLLMVLLFIGPFFEPLPLVCFFFFFLFSFFFFFFSFFFFFFKGFTYLFRATFFFFANYNVGCWLIFKF